MDAKEIKQALKGIKESLDLKDFKSAIKQCKAVLKSDRSNYLALVFFGVALQETEQKDEAPKAFKKAIELKPENDLAWKGIVSYYEKLENPECRQDLLNAYERLIVLETDPNKYNEFIRKYENLAVMIQDNQTCKELYRNLNGMPDYKKSLLKETLLTVLLACMNGDAELMQYKKEMLREVIVSETPPKLQYKICKQYLDLLKNDNNLREIIIDGSIIIKHYPDEICFLESICMAFAELYIQSDYKLPQDLIDKQVYSILLELVPESYLGSLCKGIHELQSGDPANAIDLIRQSIKEEPQFVYSWIILCKCQTLLYQFTESELSAQEALSSLEKGIKNEKLISNCMLWLIQSLSEQEGEEKWLKAVETGSLYIEKNPIDKEVLPYMIKALIKLNRFSEVDKHMSELMKDDKFTDMAEYLKCLRVKHDGHMQEYKKSLEKVVKERTECFEAWLELGKIYFNEKNKVSCLSSLLKSAKLNQLCYLNFLYLGHYYKDLMNDLDKARRCYQKAFHLNPECIETGVCLSDVYRAMGKDDLNEQLLNVITIRMPKLKFGWLNLGIHYLSINKYQDAVNSLRVATRLNPGDRSTWEILADAYFYQGAYISSLKSYNRVIDLGSDSIYPLLQIAVVKQYTGKHEDSIQNFREIIEKYPKYLPALKGHADACVSLMKQCLSRNLNGLAMDNCQEAVNSLIKCLGERKDLVCVWKLLGDACVLLSNLPEKYCKLTVSSKFVTDRKLREGQTVAVLNKTEILLLASRSYCEALCLYSDSSGLWYDLAICYNYMAIYESCCDKRKSMRELALSAVKKSIQVDEKNWESWNLLGVIYASDEIKNFLLAQHCFIKALEENETSPVVWTNLGTLYLCLHDLKLANQSFAEAQRFGHDYAQCWIGQAMIAHQTDHHDAMDLFRHSNHLGIHPEGSLGYGNLVCRTLLDTKNKNDKNYIYSIKNMNAVAVACDALTWYTDRITNNPCAFNMLGLLLERQKLYRPACKAFHSAVSLLLMNAGEDEEYSDILDKALLNYGRSLKNIGKYEEAVAVLKQIRKANFTNQCGLAEAYFKAQKYEEAYSSYEITLEWLAPDSGFKSHILVAMAAVVYMHQGKEDAKILLIQASQLKPPSVQGLFACCALGMLHSDLSLSELSLKELSQYRDDPMYLNHIAIFESYTYLFKGEKEKAIRVFSKAIHRHPEQPSLWLSLSLLLLHLYPSFDSQTAANCAEVAINSGRSAIDISKVMSLVSLSNLLSGKGLKSLRSSQKAVHMFPHETENWVVLVASVLSKCLVEETEREITWLKKTISYIRRKLEASKAMTQWLSNNERKVTVMADRSRVN